MKKNSTLHFIHLENEFSYEVRQTSLGEKEWNLISTIIYVQVHGSSNSRRVPTRYENLSGESPAKIHQGRVRICQRILRLHRHQLYYDAFYAFALPLGASINSTYLNDSRVGLTGHNFKHERTYRYLCYLYATQCIIN